MDLVVRNGRLVGREGPVDIAASDGYIVKTARRIEDRGDIEIDASSRLVVPTFVEPHVHLDKAFLAESVPEAYTMAEARKKVREAKTMFTEQDVFARAERCVRSALAHGVTAIRTHVDIDPIVELKSFNALLKLREKYSGLLKLQLVAFPQEGVLKEPAALELLEKAVDRGADAVGGLPEAEANTDDGRKHIELVAALASERRVPLDVHCDVQPYTYYIEHLLHTVRRTKIVGGTTADHLIALAYYDDTLAARIIEGIKQAGVSVVANPCTMMVSGSMDPPPRGRGITRVKELVQSGVNLAFGLDNIVDPYNPFGEFDPLRNGWLLAYQAQLSRKSDFETIMRMPTSNAASILGLERYGIERGYSADFNVLCADNARDALRGCSAAEIVVRQGKVIAHREVKVDLRF